MSPVSTVTHVSGTDPEEFGWGAWIRTREWRYQKPLPYRLATPHDPLDRFCFPLIAETIHTFVFRQFRTQNRYALCWNCSRPESGLSGLIFSVKEKHNRPRSADVGFWAIQAGQDVAYLPHTASSLPAGSVKWKRRPPVKEKIGRTILPPAFSTAASVSSRFSE